MSQLSQPPAFSYANQRVVRPPLSRQHRNRAFLAGAISNSVLTAGLTIVTLAGILFLIVAIMSLVREISRQSMGDDYWPLEGVLSAFGLSPDQGWVVWVVLIGGMLVGAAVSAAGIWIGKAILVGGSGTPIARPWAVTWSATGILVGLGLISSTVISPLVGPLMTIIFGAVVGSGSLSGEDASGVGLTFAFAVIGTIFSVLVYAAAGALVWWWMAHALRPAP